MGYKTFVAGEEALAADVNAYLMGQTVARFSSAAARTAGLTGPTLGQLSSLDTAPGVIEYWTGTVWAQAPGGAWIPYTPSLVGASGPSTVGNGTIAGRYKLLAEKVIVVYLKFAAGSTTSYNAGGVRISLPFPAHAAIPGMTVGPTLVNMITGLFTGYAAIDTDRNFIGFGGPVSTTSTAVAGLANTHLSTNAVIQTTVTYELA